MKTTSEAPPPRASMPTAPVPAKTSRKRELVTRSPRTLKRVSRRRSLVGRRAEPFRDLRRRLRYLPAITRILFGESYGGIWRATTGRKDLTPFEAQGRLRARRSEHGERREFFAKGI